MTGISDSLMLAILSMDAYNRDNINQRVTVSGTQIGTAVAGISADVSSDSFDAPSYTWDGKTVIAYRGTDDTLTDMLTGWITGVGVLGPQAVDAINFYQNVVGKSIFPGTKPDGALSDSSEPEGQELSYSTRVRLDETRMQIEDKMVTLAPGMAVTVEIKTGTRRIIEYLMSPLLRYRQESLRER